MQSQKGSIDSLNRNLKVSKESQTGAENQFVTFTLGDEEYGVEILKVQEIIGYQTFTKVPGFPDFVKGVLNLRGAVVPVIDLRVKFRMPSIEYNKFTVIVVLEICGRVMGVIVDAVSDVITLTSEQIQPTPSFSTKIRADFIKAMGNKDNNFIIILDMNKVLSQEELELVDTSVSPTEG
ncbi:MAG: chemotaxis protein CheW [bacterium]